MASNLFMSRSFRDTRAAFEGWSGYASLFAYARARRCPARGVRARCRATKSPAGSIPLSCYACAVRCPVVRVMRRLCIGKPAIGLCACYAMSSADLAVVLSECLRQWSRAIDESHWEVATPLLITVLRIRYAMSGTETRHAPTRPELK
eukprot:3941035-Rhodomonas_salina.3